MLPGAALAKEGGTAAPAPPAPPAAPANALPNRETARLNDMMGTDDSAPRSIV